MPTFEKHLKNRIDFRKFNLILDNLMIYEDAGHPCEANVLLKIKSTLINTLTVYSYHSEQGGSWVKYNNIPNAFDTYVRGLNNFDIEYSFYIGKADTPFHLPDDTYASNKGCMQILKEKMVNSGQLLFKRVATNKNYVFI